MNFVVLHLCFVIPFLFLFFLFIKRNSKTVFFSFHRRPLPQTPHFRETAQPKFDSGLGRNAAIIHQEIMVRRICSRARRSRPGARGCVHRASRCRPGGAVAILWRAWCPSADGILESLDGLAISAESEPSRLVATRASNVSPAVPWIARRGAGSGSGAY